MRKIAVVFAVLAFVVSLSLPARSAGAANAWSEHIRMMNAKIERGYIICNGKEMPVGEARSHMAQMKAEWLRENPGQGTANYIIECK